MIKERLYQLPLFIIPRWTTFSSSKYFSYLASVVSILCLRFKIYKKDGLSSVVSLPSSSKERITRQ